MEMFQLETDHSTLFIIPLKWQFLYNPELFVSQPLTHTLPISFSLRTTATTHHSFALHHSRLMDSFTDISFSSLDSFEINVFPTLEIEHSEMTSEAQGLPVDSERAGLNTTLHAYCVIA